MYLELYQVLLYYLIQKYAFILALRPKYRDLIMITNSYKVAKFFRYNNSKIIFFSKHVSKHTIVKNQTITNNTFFDYYKWLSNFSKLLNYNICKIITLTLLSFMLRTR